MCKTNKVFLKILVRITIFNTALPEFIENCYTIRII